jgi:predicted small lipoprotein YifL
MHCWARYLFWLVVAVLGVGSMLSACGQKGDLYLSPPATEQAQRQDPEQQP